MSKRIFALLSAILLFSGIVSAANTCRFTRVSGTPFPEGMDTAGAFIGAADDAVLIAGGSGIFTIRIAGDSYECKALDSKLPFAPGGGVCASTGKILYCFGGTLEDGSASDKVLALKLEGDICSVNIVCRMPDGFVPVAAEHYKGDIYLHGTTGGGNTLYRFNIGSQKFKELSPCPGAAVPQGASLVYQHNGREEAFYLMAGSRQVWEYLPVHDKWQECAAYDGNPQVGSAVRSGSAHILFVGEDAILAYHTITDTWTKIADSDGRIPDSKSAVMLGQDIIIPTGECGSSEIVSMHVENKASFGTFNYAVVILYLLAMLGIGFYFSRKNSGTEKFFKGGGHIPWWAAGISIFATALSAITFLSIPAKAYSTDWGMFMFNMAIILTVPIVINFFLPLFRKLSVASVYQYLEERFSGSVRLLAGAFFVLFMFSRVAIVLFLPSLALNAVTGIDIYLCIILMGVVTIIYCTMGGIEAVVWGDVIQGFLLVGGAIAALVWIISGIDGGMGTYMDVAIREDKFHILNFSFDWTKPVFWVALIGGISNQLLTYTSDQSVVQKYMTVKDEKGTRRSLWLNGILSIPITLLFFGIGTGLYVFFKQSPELLNVGMTNTDSIFPHFIMCKMPVGVSGLLIAAVFAAAMSTLASNINSATTVMSVDFYSRIFKNVSDTQKVRFARIAGIIVGGLGVAMAMVLATFDIASLWDQFNFFLGLLTSGLGGLFMMGVFSKRIGARSAITGFCSSVIILILCNHHTHISSTLYGFIGLAASFLIGYLASFIFGYKK